MPEVSGEFGEFERTEVWRDLFNLSVAIHNAEEIDKGGEFFWV